MSEIEYRAWHKTEHVMGRLKTLSWDEDGKLLGGFLVGAKPGEDEEYEDYTVFASTDGRFCSVDEMEVMAFTGLRDKSGKKIFADDIVRLGCEDVCNVYYSADERSTYAGAWCVFMFGHEENMLGDYLEECEVIGNVWQHPELMGRKA